MVDSLKPIENDPRWQRLWFDKEEDHGGELTYRDVAGFLGRLDEGI